MIEMPQSFRFLFVLLHILIQADICQPQPKNVSFISTSALSNFTGFSVKQDSESERLRDRWNAFLLETSKELDFDYEASSLSSPTVVEGQTVFISCALNRPQRADSRHKVSFMRIKDFGLLFVGNQRHIRDSRFEVTPSAEAIHKSWTLQIRKANVNDSGLYECQLNTQPKAKSIMFNLTVIPWTISIEPGERIIHVGVGQELRLSCVVKTGPVIPVYIVWFRNYKIVEYDDSIDAHVSIKVHNNSNAGEYISDLLLNQVGINDSGEYRCGSDLTGEAVVRVNVVAGENEQELKSYFSESEFGSSVSPISLNLCLMILTQLAIVIVCLWLS